MSYTERLRHTWNSQPKVTLVTRELDLDICFAEQSELIDTASSPRIEDVASPHQAPPAFFFNGRRCFVIGFGTQDVRRIFDIDLKGMSHSNGKAADHESLSVLP